MFLIDCQRARRGQKWALPYLFVSFGKIHAEFEVSDKGVGPNRVWYKLTKYVNPQEEAKTNGN